MSGEVVGLGVSGAPVADDIPFDNIWKVMIDKAYHPDKFLPVNNVISKEIAPNAQGHPGIYREMTMISTGDIIKENIYWDETNGSVAFHNIAKDEVIFNKYYKDKRYIEYWMENRKGERIRWPVPKELVTKSIEVTVELARKLTHDK